MRLFSKFLMLVGGLALFLPCSYAATVTGNVKGPDGAPFMGAFVMAENTQN